MSKPLEELVKELPSDIKSEVRDFAEFLLAKRTKKAPKKLRQDWAGGLSDLSGQYTAIELQKKALEWREE